jgi:hypothetical protein
MCGGQRLLVSLGGELSSKKIERAMGDLDLMASAG